MRELQLGWISPAPTGGTGPAASLRAGCSSVLPCNYTVVATTEEQPATQARFMRVLPSFLIQARSYPPSLVC